MIDIQFKVSGARYLGGDGFAIWITQNVSGVFKISNVSNITDYICCDASV
jgi:hypothetical protein